MTVHLVTFSDENMSRSRDLCVESAMNHGVDGITWAYAASEADKSAGCGLGFWVWKPRIILDFLTDTTGGLAHPEDGDILVYADAGIEFINNVNYIIDRMDQDIFLFGNNWEHAHWCKADVVEFIWPKLVQYQGESYDSYLRRQWERFGKQAQASVIFFRVSDYSRRFVKEWLDWCLFEGGRLIDDSPSQTPNHPEFREHRHDQAILTTMAYREGIRLHYWPSVYNRGGSPEFVYEQLPEYASDDYPILFSHHRRRNHEWEQVA
jgi:hypothetical protein